LKSPQQHVLDTVELLEHILFHLPASEIFVIQRVSSLWKQVVATSPALHDKLFLRLKSSFDPSWTLSSTTDFETRGYDIESGTMASTTASNLVQLNLLLQRVRTQNASFDTKLSRPGGGLWRNAYITDPPCHSVHLEFDWHIDGSPSSLAVPFTYGRAGVHITSESGLTLGDVVDAILSQDCKYLFGREYPVTRFRGHTPLRLSALMFGTTNKIVRDLSRPMMLRFQGLRMSLPSECYWRKEHDD